MAVSNLYLLSHSEMCTFYVTKQMIKIKEKKEFTCEKKSKSLFLSLK